MMYYVNMKLTLVAIIPMLMILFGELYYGRIIQKRYLARQEAVSQLTDFVQESFSGIRVIKAFVREKAQRYAFLKENQNNMDKNLAIAKMQAIVMPLLDVITGLSSLVTLVFGGYLALTGKITLGRFVAFNQYINMLVWPMLACGQCVDMFSRGGASLKRIYELFLEQTQVHDSENAVDGEAIQGHIVFRHLTFTHQGSVEPTLHDISLDIPAGTLFAVVGRTGDGKSTLVNLLLHLYNTKTGMIDIDGRDINEIPIRELRENIAYVPQDNFLFSDTLRSNIAFGAEEDDMDALIHATKAACIHENIVQFPDGYETIVGERGVTLSGGQKQRSSIARALMKNAPILILDDGYAREIGTHEQLVARGGIYHDMVMQQQLEAKNGEVRA